MKRITAGLIQLSEQENAIGNLSPVDKEIFILKQELETVKREINCLKRMIEDRHEK